MKRDWNPLLFWLTVAGLAVAAGVGLSLYWLAYGGLILGGLLVLGVLSEWVVQELAPTSNWLLRVVVRPVAEFAVDAVAWLGAIALAPVIRRVLREQGLAEAPTLAWVAQKPRGQQGSDYFSIARKGYRVAGARFIVRPDRAFQVWHAGFRLTRTKDDLLQSDLRATVLVQIRQEALGGHPIISSHREGTDKGSQTLAGHNPPKPAYECEFSVYPSAQADRLQLVYAIGDEVPQGFDFPAAYAEQIVFVAWGDGDQFRVYFEQISVTWTPVKESKA